MKFFCGKKAKIVPFEVCSKNASAKDCNNECEARECDSDSGEFKEGCTEQPFE